MTEVILVIHLLICIALIGCVLLQRSEGGALGIGGGGGGGSLFSSRGVGNALTRTTAILAVAFFVTSITLSIMARGSRTPISVFDNVQTQGQPADKAQKPASDSILPKLPESKAPSGPQVPTGQ
jgi:preprotein translocase subunit SecG